MIRIEDVEKAHERLAKETANVGAPTYGEGVVQRIVLDGHIVLVNPVDDSRSDGRGEIAIIEFDNPRAPTEMYARQIWGPSRYEDGRERHLDLLIRVCQWGVDNGYGDLPISYARDGHVLTTLADGILIPAGAGEFSRDGRFTNTTLRRALSALSAARSR